MLKYNIFVFICLVSFVKFGYTASVPITKCTAKDTKCILSSAQALIPIFAKGIPDLGVETLDPVTFKKTIDASVSGLKLLINDLTLTGLSKCHVKQLTRDISNKKIIGKLLCNVEGEGQYEMDGQLLVVHVQGRGKLRVVLRKILITLEADMSEKTKNGKKYWDIKRFSHSFELQDKADVDFENLFTGNDVIGRAASQVLSSSGNDIVTEVGPPVIKTISTKVVENIRKFFNNVPPEELALD